MFQRMKKVIKTSVMRYVGGFQHAYTMGPPRAGSRIVVVPKKKMKFLGNPEVGVINIKRVCDPATHPDNKKKSTAKLLKGIIRKKERE